jgi:uncharacterized protein (TIGR03545 family)
MIFRKSALFALAVVAVIAAAVVFVAKNGMAGRLVESALTGMVGAPVEVEGLTLNPFTLHAGFDRLRIADAERRDRWLIEAGPADFRVNLIQLLGGKFIVSDMALENVGLTTLRSPPGPPLPPPPAAPAGGGKAGEGKAPADGKVHVASSSLDVSGLLENVDVSKLMQGRQLTSVQAIQDTQKVAEAKIKLWEDRVGKTTLPADLAAIQKDSKSLNFNVKTPDDLKKLQAGLQALQKRSGSAQKELSTLNDGWKKDRGELGTAWDKASAKSEEDFRTIKESAHLSNLSVGNVGRALFGDAAVGQFNTLLHYAELAKKALRSDKAKETKRPRRAGRWVAYPVTARVYPAFAVERIAFGGFTSDAQGKPGTRFKGELTALTSDAALYGKPLRVAATGETADKKSWTLEAAFDSRTDPAVTTIALRGGGLSIGAIDMGKSSDGLYPQKMLTPSTAMDTALKLTGDALDGSLRLTAERVTFEYPPVAPGNQRRDELAKAMRAVFSDFRSVEIKSALSGTLGDPKFAATSNVDKIVSERLNGLLGKRLAEMDAQIRGEVNQQAQAARAKAEASVKGEQAKLEQSLNGLNQQAQQAQRELDKAGKDAQNAGKKSLENSLKGLKLPK